MNMYSQYGLASEPSRTLATPSCPKGQVYDGSSHVCHDPSGIDRTYGDVKDSVFILGTLVAPPVIVGHRVYKNNGSLAAGAASVVAAFATAAVFGFSMWLFTPGMFIPLAGALAYSHFAREE